MPTNQITAKDLVEREVHYCVSSLVSNLLQWSESEFYDEILQVTARDDYESAAEYEGYQVVSNENGLFYWEHKDNPQDPEIADEFDTESEAWQDCCEYNGLNVDLIEAYEHWIVSDWLAKKLEEYGEMVSYDVHGLTIWGRTTTGQAIWIDGVIDRILQDLIAS